ncbi:RNA polymerase III transcription factor IIIC subunit-domain-containing protein [Spinellus fusiger]|nr:RNA polymerase III transcription factor IIIC subunit-domain-containing protein [Spinellus fusiger]
MTTEEKAPRLFFKDNKFLSIEYPGYINNVQRAINTLGGEKAIASSFVKSIPLELRFRPKDALSHPINGDIIPCTRLVLKVTRRVKKGSPKEDATIVPEIIGSISKTCRFGGLADFQYLVPKTEHNYALREALFSGNVDAITEYKVREEALSKTGGNVPPPVFAVTETPGNYGYRQNTHVVRVRVKQADGSNTLTLLLLPVPMKCTSVDVLVQPELKEPIELIDTLVDVRRGASAIPVGPRGARSRRSNFADLNFNAYAENTEEPDLESIDSYTRHHIFDGVAKPGPYRTFQLCDITDPDFEFIIDNPEYLKEKSTRMSGFYYLHVFSQLRIQVRRKFNSLFEGGMPYQNIDLKQALRDGVAKEKEERILKMKMEKTTNKVVNKWTKDPRKRSGIAGEYMNEMAIDANEFRMNEDIDTEEAEEDEYDEEEAEEELEEEELEEELEVDDDDEDGGLNRGNQYKSKTPISRLQDLDIDI